MSNWIVIFRQYISIMITGAGTYKPYDQGLEAKWGLSSGTSSHARTLSSTVILRWTPATNATPRAYARPELCDNWIGLCIPSSCEATITQKIEVMRKTGCSANPQVFRSTTFPKFIAWNEFPHIPTRLVWRQDTIWSNLFSRYLEGAHLSEYLPIDGGYAW